ncbi:uncharacterized protein LOC133198664 isoform X2 [Saccostrea echinata]|uniref:uncharacterized protein LOC133198664 isoform X2 n=1 Tax=Saccostrea echinata TaxID=191078 RepID=UPI002A83ABE0|nr:uncharacterized protein LOC133198664 isoform X2 [Saccostrea echinata]
MQKMMLAILVLTIVPIVSPCSIASGTLHCTNLQRAVSTLQRGISISIMTIDNAATTGQLIDLSRFPRLQKIQILNTDLTCDDFKLTRGTTLMLKDKFCEYSGTTEASYHTTKSFASVLTESAAVAFILFVMVKLLLAVCDRGESLSAPTEHQRTPPPQPVRAIRRSTRVRRVPQRYGH